MPQPVHGCAVPMSADGAVPMSADGAVPMSADGAVPMSADGAVPMDGYDYALPDHAIAQQPVEPRSAARLLVSAQVAPSGAIEHGTVADLARLVGPGDVIVLNETRVLTARMALMKSTGGEAEVLLLEPSASDRGASGIDGDGDRWEALVRPGRRLPPGTLLYEPGSSTTEQPVVEVGGSVAGNGDGRRVVRILDRSVVERVGAMPLPPYIHEPLADPERYQTVYSAERPLGSRSSAAPTAGLHFTPELLDSCRRAGATIATVDLIIGLDTFQPITAPTPEAHVIHTERYSVPASTMRACASATRVIAVGTTSVRALESAAASGQLSGRTDLYIHGRYDFRVVDLLVTNFHLPRSSLLLLVEAFCGPVWRDLYTTALSKGYRFLSFGDAMVVSRSGPKGTSAEMVTPPDHTPDQTADW